jgi:hypothetical protein
MSYFILALPIVFAVIFFTQRRPRRRQGQPFDWTHRRRWWRPRWAFPDDR